MKLLAPILSRLASFVRPARTDSSASATTNASVQKGQWAGALREGRLHWMSHRPLDSRHMRGDLSHAHIVPDPALVERIMQFFRSVDNWSYYDTSSQWHAIARGVQQPIVTMVQSGPAVEVAQLLADPSANHLLYGFEDLYPTFRTMRLGFLS